jgi:hypothetical protein
MTTQRINIPHAKARGEWAELRFMTRAAELGIRVTKPWGDNAPYDFAIESAGHFLRIQVKCTSKNAATPTAAASEPTASPTTQPRST